jgi:hypothetical protein
VVIQTAGDFPNHTLREALMTDCGHGIEVVGVLLEVAPLR